MFLENNQNKIYLVVTNTTFIKRQFHEIHFIHPAISRPDSLSIQ
jgi:hypothetical protein